MHTGAPPTLEQVDVLGHVAAHLAAGPHKERPNDASQAESKKCGTRRGPKMRHRRRPRWSGVELGARGGRWGQAQREGWLTLGSLERDAGADRGEGLGGPRRGR